MASLVDVDEWSDYSKYPAPDNAATMLDAVSGAVRDACGWSISLETVEHDLLDSWGTTLLNLPTLKLVSVDYLSVCGELMEHRSDFIWSPRGALRLLGGRIWPWSYGEVDISYTHGYDPVPPQIKAFVVGVTNRLSVAKAGVLAEAVGGTNVQYGDRNATISLTDPELAVLAPYTLEPGRSR